MTREAATGLAVALALALALAAPVLAQDEQSDLRITTIDVADYPRMEVTAVTPSALADDALPDDAFTLTENGEARDVEVIGSTTGRLQVAVVIDVSGSMGGQPIADARTAASEFVEQLPAAAEVTVLSYATEPRVESDLSGDAEAHLDAIGALEAGGRTATFDAIDLAIEELGDEDDARRAIVLLTDGEDNESTETLETVAPRLEDSDVTFHAIEFLTNSSDHDALVEMAAVKNGSVTSAGDADGLAAVYAEIAEQLTSQHTLRYASERHGRTEVTVTLEHDGVTATATQTIRLPDAPSTAVAPEVSQPRVLRVETIDTKEHPIVEVTVVAPRELAAHDLTAEHFGLTEAAQPRDITVTRVGGTRQEVVVAIDTSGSMRGEAIEAAKEAATDFLMLLPDESRVAVLAFSEEPVEISGFTTDHDAAAAEIAGLEAGGYTSLYDTAAAAADLFGDDPTVTKSTVVLSDGGDTISSTALDDAARQLAASGASLYAVELLTGDTDHEALQALTEPGGGIVVSADDPAALADVYERIAIDLGNLYILRYRSEQFGTTELEIGVEADGVTARTTHTAELPAPPLLLTILGSQWGLVIGAALCYTALAIVILLILSPQRRSSLAGAAAGGGSALSALANRATAAAEESLRRRGWINSVNAALERAGIPLRPGEFVVLVTCGMVTLAAVGFLASGPLVAILIAALGALAARIAISVLTWRRRAKFADQLGDTLQLLAGSLRAGYSLLQAVDTVAKEAQSPTAEEFRRLVLETRLGRDLSAALQAMAERMGSLDFEWVVQAIQIHREVGGDLAGVLDTVAGTIRERNMIRRQVKALSAEGRLSAWILMALPFAVAGFVTITNREYLLPLTQHVAGWVMLFTGAVLMTIGGLWLRKVVRIVF